MKKELYELMYEIETKCKKWNCPFSNETWQDGDPCPVSDDCDTMDFRGFWDSEEYKEWKNK